LLLAFLIAGLAVPPAAQATSSGFTIAPSGKLGGVPAYFTGVTAPTPTSGWIIGSLSRHWNPKTQWAFMEQWNGKAWSRIGLPSLPPTADTTHLLSISSTTPTDVWAVGWSSTPAAGPGSLTHHQLVYRRTADGWQRVTIRANNSGDILNAVVSVSVASPTDVWALALSSHRCVEDVLHYDGVHWSKVDTAAGCFLGYQHFTQVTAVGGSTAWAAGTDCDSGCRGVARCFGSACAAGSALSAGDGLTASAGLGSNIWAFGPNLSIGGPATPLVEHWDGTSWQDETPPFADKSQAVGSGVVLPNGDLWTAGYFISGGVSIPTKTLILHYSAGGGWEDLDSPSPSPLNNKLYAIAHVGGTATGMWAVGLQGSNPSYGSSSVAHHPLLLHHS
jgi:hypothetical protein